MESMHYNLHQICASNLYQNLHDEDGGDEDDNDDDGDDELVVMIISLFNDVINSCCKLYRSDPFTFFAMM